MAVVGDHKEMNGSIWKYSNLAIDNTYCGWSFFKNCEALSKFFKYWRKKSSRNWDWFCRLTFQSYWRNPLLEKQNKTYCSFNISTPNSGISCGNQPVGPISKGKSSFWSSKYKTDCSKNQPGSKCRGNAICSDVSVLPELRPELHEHLDAVGNTSCTFQSRLPPKGHLLLNMLGTVNSKC